MYNGCSPKRRGIYSRVTIYIIHIILTQDAMYDAGVGAMKIGLLSIRASVCPALRVRGQPTSELSDHCSAIWYPVNLW